MNTTQTIQTTGGLLQGICETTLQGDRVDLFYGIPYAQAERFCPPRPVSWDGIFLADTQGKRALQSGDSWSPYPWEKCSADCLKLNMIVPATENETKLPVLIDIHGGAFQNGGADDLTKPGEGFLAGQEFIFIAPTYRLGVWGWLDLAGEPGFEEEKYRTSGSNGMLDIIAVLKWVRENIAAFGGAPDNVILTGESAGGKMIGGAMASPLAEGLFDRVILSSGATQAIRTKATAKAIMRQYLACAGITEPKALLEMSDEALMEAQKKLCAGPSTCHFGPVADGIVIPEDWRKILHEGRGYRGAALLGCNRNELGFYIQNPAFEEETAQLTYGLLGDNGAIADAAIAAVPAELPDEVRRQKKCDIISDTMYRTHTYRLAETLAAIHVPVWLYSLEGKEATHAVDLGLIWTPEDSEEWPNGMERADALRRKAALIKAYRDFVMKGKADWQPYTVQEPNVLHIDTEIYEKVMEGPDAFMDFPEESLRFV